MKVRLLLTLAACAAVKLAAMAEWAPLYRLFQFIPANLLAFFRGGEYAESEGIYTFSDFVLDYSCSGIHFFMIAVLVAVVIGRGLAVSIGSGYFLALIANTFRVGLFLKLLPLAAGRPWLHEVVGTAVFLSFLFGYYLLICSPSPFRRGGRGVRHAI
jgi:exosortase/archaeosortase family protein